MNILVEMEFGSKLYGTNSPTSDRDVKGVFMPELDDILLGKIPKQVSFSVKNSDGVKNTSEDVDREFYSLHYFMELLCQGQTVALDMLHARHTIIHTSFLWEKLYLMRKEFYTKNLEAFVGYAQRQAAKYGIRGSRISAVKNVLSILESEASWLLTVAWSELLECSAEHIKEIEPTPQGIKQMSICGKVFQETCANTYVVPILKRFIEQYGTRAQLAEQNEGIDWKAVSHAIRAAFQLRQIYETGDIIFPLKQAPVLKKIKSGEFDYKKSVAPLLEDAISYVKKLSDASDYPLKVDRKKWNKFVIEEVKDYYDLCYA